MVNYTIFVKISVFNKFSFNFSLIGPPKNQVEGRIIKGHSASESTKKFDLCSTIVEVF